MISLGKHRIIECYDCNHRTLNDPKQLEPILVEAARKSGATVRGAHFHTFSPQGVSGVVVIAESHFTIHTWPEYRYAAVDLFACGDSIDVAVTMKVLREELESREVILAGDLHRGIVNRDRLERAGAVSIEQLDAHQPWRERFEKEESWGIQVSLDLVNCGPGTMDDPSALESFVSPVMEKIRLSSTGPVSVEPMNLGLETVEGYRLFQSLVSGQLIGIYLAEGRRAYLDLFSHVFFEPQDFADFAREYFRAGIGGLRVFLRK